MSEGELDELMGEVGGPCNVMGMVNMFQEKLAGGDGNDPDELILQAFMAYDQAGKIDVKMFQHALTTWGDKMNKAEIDDIFNEFDVEDVVNLSLVHLISPGGESWLEMATTLMSSSSRPSWLMTRP